MQRHRPRPWFVWFSIALTLFGLVAAGQVRTAHAVMLLGSASPMATAICSIGGAARAPEGAQPETAGQADDSRFACEDCSDSLVPQGMPAQVFAALAEAGPNDGEHLATRGAEGPRHPGRHLRPDGRAPPSLV